MNTSRLSDIIQVLLDGAQRHRIVKILGTFQGHLNNLVSNPQNSPFQTECANSLADLESAVSELYSELEPHQIKTAEEIGATPYFLEDFPAAFKTWLAENFATPAITKGKVDEFVGQYRAYIDTLTQLKAKLTAIGVEPLNLTNGEPELGFLIPRGMFENHLEEMIKELSKVNRILRAFSELETGSTPPVEVRTISTSDPLYTFGLPLAVVLSLGNVVQWALGVWKEVEEIREIRARTLKIKSYTEEEVEEFHGKKLKRHVEKAVDEKIKKLLHGRTLNKARSNELSQELRFGLEYILAGIERGLVIEIRHLPPPSEPVADDASPEQKLQAQIVTVAKQLSFPAVDPSVTVLSLPKEPDKPVTKAK